MGEEAARGRRVGPYRLGEPLGAGGMGEVYRGFDERLERPVAMKRVLAERRSSQRARRRLLGEARAMAKVHHPAIARIHDWIESEEGDGWLVMELVEGLTLRRLLETRGPLPWRRAVELAAEVAGGLDAAHRAGLVHRDLKPGNIMVTRPGRAKILDFGLAQLTGGEPDEDPGAGALVGTVSAMSPEQALGLAVDSKTDLFALGLVLYESLTATSPFRADTPAQTLARICHREPEPLAGLVRDLPETVGRLVDELLAKAKEDRPRSARQVEARLRRMIGGAPAISGASGAVEASRVSRDHSSAGRRSSERRLMALSILELIADGEDLMLEAMPDFQAAVAELAALHGGHVESRAGHRAVLVFGYPIASPEDAARAVRLSLDAVGRFGGAEVGLRAALHVGPVLHLMEGERDLLVLGQTLERARALLDGAPDGAAILGTPDIERLTGQFDWRPVEPADEAVFSLAW